MQNRNGLICVQGSPAIQQGNALEDYAAYYTARLQIQHLTVSPISCSIAYTTYILSAEADRSVPEPIIYDAAFSLEVDGCRAGASTVALQHLKGGLC
jgi:hypothetical protein